MHSKLILACVGLLLATGCASITGTTNQSVSVQARAKEGVELSGAACELANNKGKWFVTTPGSVVITRSNDDMQVLCSKTGHEPGRASVVSWTKGSMFGNIVFGGGIGAIVDHNSGAAYEYPAVIQVQMGSSIKIDPSQPQDGQTANQQQALAPATTPTSAPNAATTSQPQPETTAAAKLTELKRLHDAGLITADVYGEEQRKILGTAR